jgi:thiol-disulfide isomerase/thioredoxin
LKTKKVISIIVIPWIVVCVILITVYSNLDKDNTPTLLENLTLSDSDGTMHAINYQEKPTVLLFFTSWCPYCNEDAPKVVSLYEKYKNELNLYGINLQNRDTPDDLQAYVDKYNIQYPVLLDQESSLYKKYGAPGFPTLILLDKKGKVTKRIVGSTDRDYIEQQFNKIISSS